MERLKAGCFAELGGRIGVICGVGQPIMGGDALIVRVSVSIGMRPFLPEILAARPGRRRPRIQS
jgi:hypothetical protein